MGLIFKSRSLEAKPSQGMSKKAAEMYKYADITQWLIVVISCFAVTGYARAQNFPELLQKHEHQIRDLEKKIKIIEDKLKVIDEEKKLGVGSSDVEISACGDKFWEFQGSHQIGVLGTWEPEPKIIKLKISRLFGTNPPLRVVFASNIKEISGRVLSEGTNTAFILKNCSFTIYIKKVWIAKLESYVLFDIFVN